MRSASPATAGDSVVVIRRAPEKQRNLPIVLRPDRRRPCVRPGGEPQSATGHPAYSIPPYCLPGQSGGSLPMRPCRTGSRPVHGAGQGTSSIRKLARCSFAEHSGRSKVPYVYNSSTLDPWQQKPQLSESAVPILSGCNLWPRLVKPPSSTSCTQPSTPWSGRNSCGGSMGITSACATTPNFGSDTWPSVASGTHWLDMERGGLLRRSRPASWTRASLSPPRGGGVSRYSQQRTGRPGGRRPDHDRWLRPAKSRRT